MKKTVKIGYVGLGRRGYACLKECLIRMADVEVVALCDTNPKALDKAAELYSEFDKPVPKLTTNYEDILNDAEIDAVIIMTGWSGRSKMAVAAMRAGKYTGIEVGCTQMVDEAWDVVRAHEETGVHVMMLENDCYDRSHLLLLNMAKLGLFGEIVHCSGGYQHYLNEDEYYEKYEHPLTREFDPTKNAGGHGGLDWYVFRAFVESVKAGIAPPIDVYDTATLLAVGALSEESIKNGGAPVEFPDFTRGKWSHRETDPQGKYSLSEVIEDKKIKLYNEGDLI